MSSEIQQMLSGKIKPIAEKYNIKSVWVFGSYARGEATENSDLDLLIDVSEVTLKGWDYFEIDDEIHSVFGENVDIVETEVLEYESTKKLNPDFINNVLKERVLVYGK
jgi:predicted nucleotidyltransferase